MSQAATGRIVNYRIGIKTQMTKEILIQFKIENAGSLVGKKVFWKNGKTKLFGKIIGLHGNSGMLRARFKKGVPGQAIGQSVDLVSS
jgi:large subunit ribosomal protein L35Ae